MNVRPRFVAGALGIVLATVLAACSTTVDGSGHAANAAPTTAPTNATDFPTTSGAPAPPAPSTSDSSSVPSGGSSSSGAPTGSFTCPSIVYPHAHLKFDCITAGLTLNTANAIWPVSLYREVEGNTHWVLEEGAGNWGDPKSASLRDVTVEVRTQMVDSSGYGTSPTLTVVRDADATVGGVPAHVLQTTITLNPSWARSRGTKVKSEHLWIVAMKVSATDYTLWYASIPDLAEALWPKVPAVMASIRVE
jgi:hypothetical protein